MSANTAERNFPALHLADGPGRDDPTEARKRLLKQLADRLDERHVFSKGQFVVRAADEIGARAKQQPVGNDLPPARWVALSECDLNAGQQRLAQLSENGGVGERTRPDRAGERLGAKKRLDIDRKPAPVRLAQARADLLAQRAQARRAAGGARRVQGAGGVFEFGQFLRGRGSGEIAEAARR